jgi:hypothetical protein
MLNNLKNIYMSEKEKCGTIELKKDELNDEQGEAINKRSQAVETENTRKQESRMMNFFNQEFFERKIDFKPK